MITRIEALDAVQLALGRSPICSLLGPRQCGKTTLARAIAAQEGSATFYDLESTVDQARLQNPMLALDGALGLVVIDEIQLRPELFSILRVVVDNPNCRAKFLILGSAAPELIRHVSETLAGRIEFVELSGFNPQEVGAQKTEKLWTRGGFPRSFLASSERDSWAWRENFIQTFLERDIPQLGIHIPPARLRRFWTMIAHYHGQTLNASAIGRSLDTDAKTVHRYFDILCGTFMVRRLQPWFANISKRQVKAPKIYLRDSGLLHSLLGIQSYEDLSANPKLGASWEGYMIEVILNQLKPTESYFWSTHSGAELDLLLFSGGKKIAIELKWKEAPKTSKSMHVAIEDLDLDQLFVVYPGKDRYPLSEKIIAVPSTELEF